MNQHDKELLEQIRLGDRSAKEEFLSKQMSLVIDMVHLFQSEYGLSAEDLSQLGTIGLIKAIDRYDPEENGKFSVFAIPFICDEIVSFYAKEWGADRSVLEDLDRYFVKAELIPAIVVDEKTNAVLMLAYMNKASLRLTLQTGFTWYYSRSRQDLWNKGATSGNVQRVKSITADCDDDTLLIVVDQTGPACHTGSYSCFFKELKPLFPTNKEEKEG